MDTEQQTSASLAAAITKAASKQTYYTIRLFVDRERINDAYRAYGYFRWVDNVIDTEAGSRSEKIAFVNHQTSLLEACYRGEIPDNLSAEEWMLVDLVHNDTEEHSGLQSYLRNMMAVMLFDAYRRDKVISQKELSEYSQTLATAVTEALHYFIGHNNPTPYHEARYLAVTAAHITHMLRDALEDTEIGYFNVPYEYLQTCGISPQNVKSLAYSEWVRGRVQLARMYFKASRSCTAQVRSLRCRLAGYAYTARFEWMLRRIEHDGYRLRLEYPERKRLSAGLWMAWTTLAAFITSPLIDFGTQNLAVQPVRVRDL